MFKSVLWGLILGGLAGLAVVAIVYLPGLAYGVSRRELLDGFRLLVVPGLAGGLLLGIAAGLVREKRRLRLLLLAFGLYPLLTIGTVSVLGHSLAWQTLLVAAFLALAYFPIVLVPVGAGVLVLERLTRPIHGGSETPTNVRSTRMRPSSSHSPASSASPKGAPVELSALPE